MVDVAHLHKVHDYVLHHAQHNAAAAALGWQGNVISYGDLHTAVETCAAALLRAGVEPGDRVAVLGSVCPEYLITFLATSMVGCIWLGLNPRYQAPEIEHILVDAEPRVLFAAAEFDSRDLREVAECAMVECASIRQRICIGGSARPGWQGFDEFLRKSLDCCQSIGGLQKRIDQTRGADPVALIYTSGTTGKPKGALLSHTGLIGRAVTQNRMWPCTDIRIINPLPINHIGGLGFISIYAIVGGGVQFLMERFEPEAFIEQLERHRITVWIGLPVVYHLILNHSDFRCERFPHLQWAIWSGAPMPAALIERLRQLGCRLGTSYGLTETSGSVCYAPESIDQERLSRTIGCPTPTGEVRLAGPDGTRVPVGADGEIQVRPEWAMTGYFRRPEASREARTPDGWIRTGDIGRIDGDGNIELVGRLKEMFKSGGYNIYPREVELAVESHIAVTMCAVVPIPDETFQEVGVAYVQLSHGAIVEVDELRQWCRDRMANYKVPKHFIVLEQIPMLSVGKVDKPHLRALAAALAITSPAREGGQGQQHKGHSIT